MLNLDTLVPGRLSRLTEVNLVWTVYWGPFVPGDLFRSIASIGFILFSVSTNL